VISNQGAFEPTKMCREEERAADPAAGVVRGVVAPNQEGVRSRRDLELLALDPLERPERGAVPAPQFEQWQFSAYRNSSGTR